MLSQGHPEATEGTGDDWSPRIHPGIRTLGGERRNADEAGTILDWLLHNSAPGFPSPCWGYPYPWQDVGFFAPPWGGTGLGLAGVDIVLTFSKRTKGPRC